MSMVIGYAYGQSPTYTAADIDQMYEAESARIWEELNAPDPNESKYRAAAGSLKKAAEALNAVLDNLAQGVEDAAGLPLSDKIAFYLNDFEDRQCDIKQIMERALRGVEL